MAKSARILVTGDINGNFSECFSRVNKVCKKSGPFDILLCAGNFFPKTKTDEKPLDDLTNPNIAHPEVPAYILGPTTQQQAYFYKSYKTEFADGCELFDGITLLGKRGVLTTESGVTIAYLSGSEDKESTEYTFNEDDVDYLIQCANSLFAPVDILITSQWPRGVHRHVTDCPPEVKTMAEEGSNLIAKVAFHLKPRYHFASSATHFERQPYRNHLVLQEVAKPVTRFISLAEVGNKAKAKWLYAFQVTPTQKMDRSELIKQPPDTTECPYADHEGLIVKSKQSEIAPQFFYDMKNYDEEMDQPRKRRGQDQRGGRGGKQNRQDRPKDPCWFCLSSPGVEKHLVVSIGDHSYLAMAKGGLVDEHLLILPINHCRSLLELTEEDPDVSTEIERFKSALNQYFCKKDEIVVYFERNFRSSHLQLQVVPIPSSKKETIKEMLMELSEERGNPLNQVEESLELKDVISPGIPYFYVEVPAANVKLFCKIHAGKGFPLQLGRELLAHPRILNVGQRIDWKNCALSKEEATKMTNRFRKDFEPFDFTLL